MMTQRLPRAKRLLKKVGTKLLILGYYAPVIVYVYSHVLYKGIKCYAKHMTKS